MLRRVDQPSRELASSGTFYYFFLASFLVVFLAFCLKVFFLRAVFGTFLRHPLGMLVSLQNPLSSCDIELESSYCLVGGNDLNKNPTDDGEYLEGTMQCRPGLNKPTKEKDRHDEEHATPKLVESVVLIRNGLKCGKSCFVFAQCVEVAGIEVNRF